MKTQKIFIVFLLAIFLVALGARLPRGRNGSTASEQNSAAVPSSAFLQSPVASFGPGVSLGDSVPGGPDVTSSSALPSRTWGGPITHAEAAYAVDLASGADLYAVNPDARWPLASLTKLMTAVVALRHFSMDTVITVAPDAFVFSASEHDEVPLEAGQRYRVRDLLAMMLLPSSNKAADALAAAAGRDAFVAEMNAGARAWGMTDTHFMEPTGLSVLNQSTPRDLATLSLHLFRDEPRILSLTRELQATVTEVGAGKSSVVRSINAFAGQPDFLGGKTGHTDEASGNLLSLFSDRGRPVVVIVVGTSDRFGETKKIIDWLENTAVGG